MRHDDPDDGDKTTVPTVPPPSGESDIYEAKTQVGGLSPEALAMLRQVRDEKPLAALGEANVPIFEDDDDDDDGPKPGRVRPAAGMPAAPTPRTPAAAPAAGGSTPALASEPDLSPVARVFSSTATPPVSSKIASVPPLVLASQGAAEPESYDAVFAPLPPSKAGPSAPPRAPAAGPSMWPIWVIAGLAGFVLIALAIVLLARAGLIPGLAPASP